MARKLYIFNPVGRIKPDATLPPKWIGNFSSNYTYLGDLRVRLLGVGNSLRQPRRPEWLAATAETGKPARSGASRYDRNFRGWS